MKEKNIQSEHGQLISAIPHLYKKNTLRDRVINWGIFLLLSIIWGSSFILMKEGMHVLTPYQVASIRILSAGLILTPFAVKALKQIPQRKWFLVLLCRTRITGYTLLWYQCKHGRQTYERSRLTEYCFTGICLSDHSICHYLILYRVYNNEFV